MEKKVYKKVSSYEAHGEHVKKAVLLYSGGLDSSIMIKWLQEEYNCEVIALTINLGQLTEDLNHVKQKALDLGAKKAIVIDAVEEFAQDYIFKGIKANASYQGNYYLSTPLGRPLIAKHAVNVALEEEADAIAHGCTGKGNDQIRLDAGILTLCPNMQIIAPVREWDMTREKEHRYAIKHDIPITKSSESLFSHDDNIWGVTSEGGDIEDPKLISPIAEALRITTHPADAPEEPEIIKIGFKGGNPVSLNGEKLSPATLISKLNTVAGQHGIGICTLIEDRIIGMKVRGIYEGPAAAVLVAAHADLEKLVCTRTENEMKAQIDLKWAYMCYGAHWFEPLMESLNAFIETVNKKVTGEVTVQLYKGSVSILAIDSGNSLFDEHSASFNSESEFNTNCSAPFIELYSLAAVKAAEVKMKQEVGQ